MTDREKVVEGLRKALAISQEVDSDFIFITKGEGKKALELLKEQEPVYPNLKQTVEAIHYTCGNCGTDLMRGKYCPECGRKVKCGCG